MTSQREAELRASSMNALAHGADCLYTPLANPVSRMTALRGAELIATALDDPPGVRDRPDSPSARCSAATRSTPPSRAAPLGLPDAGAGPAAPPMRRPTPRSCRAAPPSSRRGRRGSSTGSRPRSAAAAPEPRATAVAARRATPPGSAGSGRTAAAWSRAGDDPRPARARRRAGTRDHQGGPGGADRARLVAAPPACPTGVTPPPLACSALRDRRASRPRYHAYTRRHSVNWPLYLLARIFLEPFFLVYFRYTRRGREHARAQGRPDRRRQPPQLPRPLRRSAAACPGGGR